MTSRSIEPFRTRVALIALSCALAAAAAGAQPPNTTTRESIAVSGIVDRIDPFARALTLRTSAGQMQVYVAREVKVFDELKTGDSIKVRVIESVIVAARPGAKLTVPADTTAAAKKEPAVDQDVMQQLKATVRIESVDRATNMVVYTAGDNRRVVRQVADRGLLEGLNAGDVVEITYTRARAIEIERQP